MPEIKIRRFATFVCGFVMLAVTAMQAGAEAGNRAEYVSQHIPSAADMGSIVPATLTLKNVGTETWTHDRKAALEIKPANATKNWGVTRVALESSEAIPPGESKTFRFDLHIPDTPGDYPFNWQMTLDEQALPILAAPRTTIRVDDPLARATFVSQLTPDQVAPGERFKALLQFRNDGRAKWSRANGVRLAATNFATAKLWNLPHVELEDGEYIMPGEIATFSFQMTAPTKPGGYDLGWRMFQDGRRFFGEAAPPAEITVGHDAQHAVTATLGAEFVGQTIPNRVQPNQMFNVTLLFKNTGALPWLPGAVTLTAQPPANNLLWLLDEVELPGPQSVSPGDIKAFEFTVRAPAEMGSYPFVWRLYHTTTGSFGDRSELQQINVSQ